MKKHSNLPDFSKLCTPEQNPIQDKISLLIHFFFLGSFSGFLWETLIFLVKDNTFRNRGFFYGPWLPVYGIGAVVFYCFFHHSSKKISGATHLSGRTFRSKIPPNHYIHQNCSSWNSLRTCDRMASQYIFPFTVLGLQQLSVQFSWIYLSFFGNRIWYRRYALDLCIF